MPIAKVTIFLRISSIQSISFVQGKAGTEQTVPYNPFKHSGDDIVKEIVSKLEQQRSGDVSLHTKIFANQQTLLMGE